MSKKNLFYFALIPILIYLAASFFIVKDYGIMIDDPEQFGVGHKNLHYYLTGKLNYQDNKPEIQNHPNFYNYIVKTRPHHIWPFTPMLSAATCKIFFEKLNWLPPVPAHHFVIPLLTALFFLLFFFFVRRWWGDFATICAVLMLMTWPRFFGHSLSNIKDLPEVLFFSLTIMYFMDWYLPPRQARDDQVGYLYLSFLFFGLAVATKADAIFVIPILGLWLLPDLINNLTKDTSIKIRILFHFCIGALISFLFIFFTYPQLQPWYYKSKYDFLVQAPKFIYTLARYIIGIGGDIDSTWNLYSIKQIFYTTPVLMLLFFAIGFVFTLIRPLIRTSLDTFSYAKSFREHSGRAEKHNLQNPLTLSATLRVVYRRVNLLLLIWLLLPVLRHCMPKVNHYDGLRHFMVFMVPFVIITTIGIINFAKFISRKLEQQSLLNLKQNMIETFFLILIVLPNLYSVITLHPYQTTFYNKIIGGLGGAQKKEIPFSSDYWFNSNLELGEWLNKNAKQNANIHGPFIDYYLNPSTPRRARGSGRAGDLKKISLDKKNKIPSNTYIVEIPRKWYRLDQKLPLISELIPEIKKLEIVYQIKRQNGVIATIYYQHHSS